MRPKRVDYSIIAIAVVALRPLCLGIFCIKAFFCRTTQQAFAYSANKQFIYSCIGYAVKYYLFFIRCSSN